MHIKSVPLNGEKRERERESERERERERERVRERVLFSVNVFYSFICLFYTDPVENFSRKNR